MAYSDEQKAFYTKAKAAGWDDAKIKAGIARLAERAATAPAPSATAQTAVTGNAPAAPASGVQGTPRAQPAPSNAPVDDGTAWMTDYKPTDGMNWGQKFVAGYGSAIPKLALGARQVLSGLTGEDPEMLRQKAEEDRKYSQDLMDSGGGMVGSIAGNIAATAPLAAMLPGLAPAAGAGALARTGLALGRVGIGAAEGAGTAALAPTVREGERESNMGWGGAIGGAIPGVGTVLRSAPFNELTEAALDWNPATYSSRLTARNKAGKALVEDEADKLRLLNEQDKAQYGAKVENLKRDKIAAAAAAKDEAARQTEAARLAEAARVGRENALREVGLDKGRAEVVNRAGWEKLPANKMELEEQVGKVGERYGALIEPLQLDATTPLTTVTNAAAKGGLTRSQANALSAVGVRIEEAASINGKIPGQLYKTIRSELTSELSDARGLYRDQLKATVSALDNALKNSVDDPKTYEEILKQRQQYSLGMKLRTMGFDPSQPLDLFKAQRHLDTRGNDATGTREFLTNLVANTPKKPLKPSKIDPVLPSTDYGLEDILEMPPTPRAIPKFESEHSDYAKLGLVNTLLTMGLGPAQFGAAPTMDILRKAAKNKPTSTMLSRLLRGYTQTELSD